MKRLNVLICVILFISLFSLSVFANNISILNSDIHTTELHLLKLYYCDHPLSHIYEIKSPTCDENGEGYRICSICGRILRINTVVIDNLGCNFGDWVISKKCTPLSDGEKIRTCIRCENLGYQSYQFNTIGKNYIYIPTADIHTKLYIGDLTQSNIDIYDLVYDRDYYGIDGVWVLGHQYGSLKNLHKTKVGDMIYIGVNGISKGYVVRYSEFALQNSNKTDIIGQTSNISVLSNLDGETLHIYTCYGKEKNHRWMVLAELVEN